MKDTPRPPSTGDRAARPAGILRRLWRLHRGRGIRRRLRAVAGHFVWQAVARRGMVGALAPSSRRLAHAMALAARGADLVVELGAGTGAITAALVEARGLQPLVAVEIDPRWADTLKRRFPGIDVRCAPADEMLAQVAPPASHVVVLVSSLPFRSLPPHWHQRTRAAIERFLLADRRRRLVQFTYQPRPPFETAPASPLAWRCRHAVRHNLPPGSRRRP